MSILRFESSFLTSLEAWAAKRDSAYIVTLINPIGTDTIADLGAGNGYVANKIADQSKALVAIEPDVKRARHMHRTYPKLDCVLAVGEAVPFRDSSFEKSYAKKSLHHVTDLERALHELNRILRPDGALVIQEPKPEGRWKLILWFERRIWTYPDFLTPDTFKERLYKTGFSVKLFENKANGFYIIAEKRAVTS